MADNSLLPFPKTCIEQVRKESSLQGSLQPRVAAPGLSRTMHAVPFPASASVPETACRLFAPTFPLAQMLRRGQGYAHSSSNIQQQNVPIVGRSSCKEQWWEALYVTNPTRVLSSRLTGLF